MVDMKAKKPKHNDASEIAKRQNMVTPILVWEDSIGKVSKRAWTEGQELHSREDRYDFHVDATADQLSDKDLPIALTEAEVIDEVAKITGNDADPDEGPKLEQERVNAIIAAHRRKKPLAIAAAKVSGDLEKIAVKLAPALGQQLDSAWSATKELKYKAAELAHIMKTTLSPEELASIPDWDSEKPKGETSNNANYNRKYRTRAGTDYGTPSWIGDLSDRMPDVGGFKLGLSVVKRLEEINPEHLGDKEMERKGQEIYHDWTTTKKHRANLVQNLTAAVRLMQRMTAINEFKLVKVEFRKVGGKIDVQNLAPIKMLGYELDEKGKLELKDTAFFPINKVVNWQIEHLSRTTTDWAGIQKDKPRDPMGKPIAKGNEARLVLKKVIHWYLGPNSVEGRRDDLIHYVSKREKGLPADRAFAHDLLLLIRMLKPLEDTLEAGDAIIQAKDEIEKTAAIAKDDQFQAALRANHKAA